MKIVIAGGGTGGHLFPGVAIAEEFRRRSPENEVLFIGTKRGIEARVLPQIGFPLATLEVEGIKGRGIARSMAAFAKIPPSLIQSRRIIRGFKPRVVIGVGGYASGPANGPRTWRSTKPVGETSSMRASQRRGSGPSHRVNSISSPSARRAGARWIWAMIGGGVMAPIEADWA